MHKATEKLKSISTQKQMDEYRRENTNGNYRKNSAVGMSQKEIQNRIGSEAALGVVSLGACGFIALAGFPVLGTILAAGATIYSGYKVYQFGSNTMTDIYSRQERAIEQLYSSTNNSMSY